MCDSNILDKIYRIIRYIWTSYKMLGCMPVEVPRDRIEIIDQARVLQPQYSNTTCDNK